jgi:hypothetical protein
VAAQFTVGRLFILTANYTPPDSSLLGRQLHSQNEKSLSNIDKLLKLKD